MFIEQQKETEKPKQKVLFSLQKNTFSYSDIWSLLALYRGKPINFRQICVNCIMEMLTIESRAQELCERGGEWPRLTVPNSPYGLCGSKATLKKAIAIKVRLCQHWVWQLKVLQSTAIYWVSAKKEKPPFCMYSWSLIEGGECMRRRMCQYNSVLFMCTLVCIFRIQK